MKCQAKIKLSCPTSGKVLSVEPCPIDAVDGTDYCQRHHDIIANIAKGDPAPIKQRTN